MLCTIVSFSRAGLIDALLISMSEKHDIKLNSVAGVQPLGVNLIVGIEIQIGHVQWTFDPPVRGLNMRMGGKPNIVRDAAWKCHIHRLLTILQKHIATSSAEIM